MTRVPIKYSHPFIGVLRITGTPPRSAYVDISDESVRVRMGWAFQAEFPRAAVDAVDEARHVVSAGVHGWRGRWIVNGAPGPIARLTLPSPVRARVMGVPVRVQELLVSVDDIAELKRLLIG
jgi:hypothetical protein